MDHQTMERLLIDRAVGHLDRDAAALLADYLKDRPALQETAESIEQTVGLAERAFQRCESIELPPLDQYRIERSRRRSRRSKLLSQVLAVAATFVLGASTALLVSPDERQMTDGRDWSPPVSTPPKEYAPPQPIGDEDFWSLKRISVTAQVRSHVGRERQSRTIRQAVEATF